MADVECVNMFEEVKKDIDGCLAKTLASSCLNCKNPMCRTGCPLNINIPAFIEKIKKEEYASALKIISEKSVMPEVCGRVCPQEKTCQVKCIKGLKGNPVEIGVLERFVSNYEIEDEKITDRKEKIAIVGSGPAGLSCAYHLRKKGFQVTIYEASHKLGGVLIYGIPEFRLPKSIVENIINRLKKLGVIFKTDTLVGKTITLDELKRSHEYVVIATGAGTPKNLDIPGIMAKNVISANELLTRVNLMKSPFSDTPLNSSIKSVVIGGGNVALDAARVLKRLGSDVTLCYRKDEENLKMREEEKISAKNENVNFKFNMVPVEIISDEYYNISSVIFNHEGKNIELKCDTLVIAIGTTPNKTILNNTNIQTLENGCIAVNNYITSDEGILAIGDARLGNATVIDALKDGYESSKIIEELIESRRNYE